MDRRNRTKPAKSRTNYLKNIGSVHSDQESSIIHRAPLAEDPMAEELRQISCEGNSSDESRTELHRHWLPIDRSRVVGAGRPWDGLAYVAVRKYTEPERHRRRRPQSRHKKPSSLDVERGSVKGCFGSNDRDTAGRD